MKKWIYNLCSKTWLLPETIQINHFRFVFLDLLVKGVTCKKPSGKIGEIG